jgi:protein gp37
MRLASRLEAMGQRKYLGTTRKTGGRPKWNGRINFDRATLDLPKRWTTAKTIFVNSMSDLFHDDIPRDFVRQVFATMLATPHHTYQVLTKRAERLEQLAPELPWPDNVWMGVSVENAAFQWRIDHLRRTQAAVKFLSLEPLLGPLDSLNLTGIDWAIAGGESGPNARPMQADWVRAIRNQCRAAGVAFHFKQWGGFNKKRAGRMLDGRTWDEIPIRTSEPPLMRRLFDEIDKSSAAPVNDALTRSKSV